MDKMNNSADIFHPIQTKRASEAIYEQVKDKIVAGELKPGDRLPSERNMMDLFQRSRPTIREALRMLERAGYIKTIPGSNGAIVTIPDGRNMEETIEDALQIGQISLAEMAEYRRVSEGAAAGWAAERGTEEDIEALRQCLESMESVMDDIEAFMNLDSQFHNLIASAAKNRVSCIMNSTISKLNRAFIKDNYASLSPAEQVNNNQRINEMHRVIYQAIAAHEPEQARKAMDEHLVFFLTDLSK